VLLTDIRRYEWCIMVAIAAIGVFIWTIYYFRKRKLRKIAAALFAGGEGDITGGRIR
jgi:hypothetical protein